MPIIELEYLPRHALKYENDPELERSFRVTQYRKQVDAHGVICKDDRQRRGTMGTRVRLLEVWSIATRQPMEFDSLQQACSFLGWDSMETARRNVRRKWRINGTLIERIEDSLTICTKKNQAQVRMIDIAHPDGGPVFNGLGHASRSTGIPKTSLFRAMRSNGFVGDKQFVFIGKSSAAESQDGVISQASARIERHLPVQSLAFAGA